MSWSLGLFPPSVRPVQALRFALACAVLAASLRAEHVSHAKPAEPQAKPTDITRQILWQRSLEDALAIAKAESRPILVAVNMDGESASERIVRDRYRDPAFVALTRPFVCVVASAFRHAPRDHDDEGRRIPCPRLGEITCGEHIALEPILFDRYLGGERIAPRHALILPDGTKSFDLFLLFDLRDLDKKLADSQKLAPPPNVGASPPGGPGKWLDLACAKDHRTRLAFETELVGLRSEKDCERALQAIIACADAGSVEGLRILLVPKPRPSAGLLEEIGTAAQVLHVEAPLAIAIRERLASLGRWPGAPGLGDDEALLPLLGRLDGNSGATRSLLFSYFLLGNKSEASLAAAAVVGSQIAGDLVPMFSSKTGESAEIESWLSTVREAGPAPERPAKPPEELPAAEALETELADLDHALESRPDDPDLLARYGRATLALARRRMDSGVSGAQLLLQDADRFLARASASGPANVSLLLDRARTAYLMGHFEEEERIALEAEAAARGDERIETLRWLGDAAARMLASRSGGDPAVEMHGIVAGARALMDVAAGPTADETDWISLASFLGALGMRREELAVLQLGAERLPASPALRSALNAALWTGGRIDLAAPKAEWIAAQHPDSADCAWHAGYARILAAEDSRRGEDPDRAIAEYGRAERRFHECAALKPDYKENTDHYLALCALGRGFAHLLADRRAEAAQCLGEGVALRPAVASARDGLDREALDLLDGSLEWRDSGASPVDVAALLDALERADPGNAFWERSISDSELREALRADGRGEIVEGDRYLRTSIAAARRALAIASGDDNAHALAQPLTVLAERLLRRGDVLEARKSLAEAAPLLGQAAPGEDADAEVLKSFAVRLREALGAARPRFRPGR